MTRIMSEPVAGRAPSQRLTRVLLPSLVLALGLAATLGLWQQARQDAAQVLRTEFSAAADAVTAHLAFRVETNVQVLRGVAALFDASDWVTRQDFSRYVADLRLPERYPGIQAVGFSRLLTPAEKDAELLAMHRDGFADFAIRPPGERDFYTAVVYIEPFAGRNLRAFGYDMAPEPVRWAAATRARDTGEPALSGKVTLRQEATTDIQPGFVLFVPVYRQNSPTGTLEQRQAALIGWVFSPLRMHELMRGVLGQVTFQALQTLLDVEVYDGDRVSPDSQLFTLHSTSIDRPDPAFGLLRRLPLGGRTWTIRVTSTPAFDARLHQGKPLWVALAGGLASLLLALVVWVRTASRQRIAAALQDARRHLAEREHAEAAIQALNVGLERRVAERTADLQAEVAERQQIEHNLRDSERRFRELFEHLPIAYQSLDGEGRWLDANLAMADLLGFDRPEEMIGLHFGDYWDDATGEAFAAAFAQLKACQGINAELRLRRRDGLPIAAMLAGRTQTDAAGRFEGTHCVLSDITEWRAREDEIRALNAHLERKVDERAGEVRAAYAALQESETRYRSLVETTSDCIWELDAQGRFAYISPRFREMTGDAPEQYLGKTPLALLPDGAPLPDARAIGRRAGCPTAACGPGNADPASGWPAPRRRDQRASPLRARGRLPGDAGDGPGHYGT